MFRNDAIDVAGVRALKPDRIVVSPGPCTPREAGISCDVIRTLGKYWLEIVELPSNGDDAS